MRTNQAAWLRGPRTDLEVGPAPYTPPDANEIVVENHALAVNPLEWILQLVGKVIYPWIKYPFVVGSDVSGEVVEVGSDVTRFALGDRVLGHAVGTDKDSHSSARGGFQHYSVILDRMASPIPDTMPYEHAVVLPLGLSTAACALFQQDQLALQHPSATPTRTGQTLLVWGGSTSVGSNAIQLAVAAGYDVFTTASPRNFGYVTDLGATRVFDYNSPTVVDDLVAAFTGTTLAGAFAIAAGSASLCADVVHACHGNKFISIASPPARWQTLVDHRARLPLVLAGLAVSGLALLVKCRLRGIRTKSVFGTSLKHNEVSTTIYTDFLPAALADRRYVTAPNPLVVGHGLEYLQTALDAQMKGVSAQKLVITL